MTDPASRPLPEPASAAALRAQLLATERWSLLATRSTTQSELLSRITMLLTMVSASLVSLALIGQATAFDGPFTAIALTLGSFVVVVGTLTLVRVNNASNEDLAHVIGMNRLRSAYVELDPGLARFLVASSHDDDQGISQTYNPLEGPKRSQVIGSSLPTFSSSRLPSRVRSARPSPRRRRRTDQLSASWPPSAFWATWPLRYRLLGRLTSRHYGATSHSSRPRLARSAPPKTPSSQVRDDPLWTMSVGGQGQRLLLR